MHVCIYIYIINVHSTTQTYYVNQKKIILDAINRD